MRFIPRDSCLVKVTSCQLGLTFSFRLAINDYEDDSFVFSCGADDSRTTGISAWYRNNRLNVRLRTFDKEWTVRGVYKKSTYGNRYVNVEISWNIDEGITLWLNGKEADADPSFTQVTNILPGPEYCKFGEPISGSSFASIAIADLNVVLAPKTLLTCFNIDYELPKFTSSPEISVSFNATSGEAELVCIVEKLERSDVIYFTEFYFSGSQTPLEVTPGMEEEMVKAYLNDSMIQPLNFGDKISCRVSACIAADCANTRGPARESNMLTAEIQIIKERLEVFEGQIGNIQVKSTIPPSLFCPLEDRGDDCSLHISAKLLKIDEEIKCPVDLGGFEITQLVFPLSSSASTPSDATCRYDINILTTQEMRWEASVTIQVLGTVDLIKDGDQERSVQLTATIIAGGLNFGSVTAGKVKVNVKDRDGIRRRCESMGDPHHRTFDGRTFDNYKEGEFILYKHNFLPYEVRTFQLACNGRAACNCGLAVKSGDDVILLDGCRSGVNDPLRTKIFTNGELTQGTSFDYNQKTGMYKITLPTGMVIRANPIRSQRIGFPFLDIVVTASSLDFQNTMGLCGTFDDDETNDFMTLEGSLVQSFNEFLLSWRVDPSESIYNGICATDAVLSLTTTSCNCLEDDEPVCSVFVQMQTCNRIQGLTDGSANNTADASDSDANEVLDSCKVAVNPNVFKYDPDYTFPIPTWPTASGITKEQAENKCKAVLEASLSLEACGQLLGELTITVTIENCVADIQILDNLEYAVTILAQIQVMCITEAETSGPIDGNGQQTLPPDVLNNLCPEDCSGHGDCTAGTCMCDEDWLGIACNIPYTEPPRLISIGGGDQCDKRLRSCNKIEIYGFGFADTSLLTCRIHSLEDNTVITVPAVYVTAYIVDCSFDKNGNFEISVSNNQLNFSNVLTYTCFDSVCLNCTDGLCTPRTDICIIDGECYAEGYCKQGEPELICWPIYSGTDWTRVTADDVDETRVIFSILDGTNVSSSVGLLPSSGTLSLTFVKYGLGIKTLLIFEPSSWVSLSPVSSPCLRDLRNCNLGLTISFSVKFTELVEGGYLFTNCADDPDAAGIAVYYERQRMYFILSTKSVEWVTYVEQNQFNEDKFYNFEITWSAQLGLRVFIDSNIAGQEVTGETRLGMVSTKQCDFKLGEQQTGYTNLGFQLVFINFIYADKKIVDTFGVPTGFPQLTEKPRLVFSVNEFTKKATLECQFNTLDRFTYYTQFLLGTRQLTFPKVNNTISEDDLPYLAYGSELLCSVYLCPSEDVETGLCFSTSGTEIFSEPLKVAFELETTKLIVAEGELGSAKIISLVPPYLMCPEASRNSCDVRILSRVRGAREKYCPDKRIIPQAVILWGQDDTSGAFCGIPVSSVTWQREQFITIKGVVDNIRNKDQERVLELSVSINSASTNFSTTEELGRVELTIEDKDEAKICGSVNDPHTTTFDGKKYDVFMEGEYILYQHLTYPYAVHAFFTSCNKVAACNCAVAVKVYDDVVVMDKCPRGDEDPLTVPFKVTLYRNGQLERGFRVYQKREEEYTVYLPNGDVVYTKVERLKQYINVWVTAAGASASQTQGLCGTYDGDESNDLLQRDGIISNDTSETPNEFSLTWRVQKETSIYTGFCGPPSDNTKASGSYFCDCPYNSAFGSKCGRGLDVFQCTMKDDSVDGDGEDDQDDRATRRKGSDITDTLIAESSDSPAKCVSTEVPPEFEFNSTYVFKPEDQGISLQNATELCSTTLSVAINIQGCGAILGVQFDFALQFCIKDLMMTGQLKWIDVAVENVRLQCQIKIDIDEETWEEGDDGKPILPPVVDKMCPGACSNNGQCDRGFCKCDEGFAGDDCGILLSEPPRLISLAGGFLCDTSGSQDCSTLTIYGFGFAQSRNLSCRLEELQVGVGGLYEKPIPAVQETSSAQFVRGEIIKCPKGISQVIEISCTNDGVTYSDQTLKRVTYNSMCQICDENSCLNRTDVCVIDNECYEDGFVNTENATQKCDINNRFSWTEVTAIECGITRLGFNQVVDSVLLTNRFNISIRPAGFTSGLSGTTLRLDGMNQSVELIPPSSPECLFDVDQCDLGLRLEFSLKLLEVKDG
ncbi:hypothetical protein EGW08_011565, partial [Elysia chlorotica]